MKTYKQFKTSTFTCIIKKQDEVIYTSDLRGVPPLLQYLKHQQDQDDLILYDKVIGKGAMLLAIKANIQTIYTPLISTSAYELGNKHHIDIYYDEKVPYIMNRDNNGMCPIENSLQGIDDIEKGYDQIIETLHILSNKSKRG